MVAEYLAHGYSPEEVCFQHPYLSMDRSAEVSPKSWTTR